MMPPPSGSSRHRRDRPAPWRAIAAAVLGWIACAPELPPLDRTAPSRGDESASTARDPVMDAAVRAPGDPSRTIADARSAAPPTEDPAPAREGVLDARGPERDVRVPDVGRGGAPDVRGADDVRDAGREAGAAGALGDGGMCRAPWDGGGLSCADYCEAWFYGGKGGQGCWKGVDTARVYKAGTIAEGVSKCLADCATFSAERLCCRMAYVHKANTQGPQDILCPRTQSACP
jgi:hypothetical protein